MLEYIEDEITVILTVYRRKHLEKQLNCILSQTKKPYQVWIYQNESHINFAIPSELKKQYNISVIHSRDKNFKFHGRFALPLLCDTEYTAVFDDDTMCGPRWLENCLDTSKRNNCIVGANGRTLKEGFEDKDTQHMISIGGGAPVDAETEVDFVGHCWFFKTAWCRNLWTDRPFSWDNGEDIHLAASCQIYNQVKCYVPKMPANDTTLWGDTEAHLGNDQHASFKKNDHAKLRADIIRYWHSRGWQPLFKRQQ